MRLRWTDVREIAIALEEAHPDADIVNLRFTDLWKWVRDLPEFDDDPNRANEKTWKPFRWPGSTNASE